MNLFLVAKLSKKTKTRRLSRQLEIEERELKIEREKLELQKLKCEFNSIQYYLLSFHLKVNC